MGYLFSCSSLLVTPRPPTTVYNTSAPLYPPLVYRSSPREIKDGGRFVTRSTQWRCHAENHGCALQQSVSAEMCRQSRSSLDLTAAGGGGGVLYTREITQSDCAPLMSLIAFAAGRGRAAAAEADNKPGDAAM